MPIVVLGGELLVAQISGDTTTGFVDARGAGTQDDADALATIGVDGLPDRLGDLQGRFHQQLVVAAVLGAQFVWQGHQFSAYRRDRQRPFRDPAGFGANARAVAGEQLARDFLLVAAQGADQSEGVQVGGHGALSFNGLML